MRKTTRAVAGAFAGAVMLVTGAAVPASAHEGGQAAPASAPGMSRMDELMMSGNPGMARMHELMMSGNPGMARMHELMTSGNPGLARMCESTARDG